MGYFNWNKWRVFDLKDDNEFENYNFLDGLCNAYVRELKYLEIIYGLEQVEMDLLFITEKNI